MAEIEQRHKEKARELAKSLAEKKLTTLMIAQALADAEAEGERRLSEKLKALVAEWKERASAEESNLDVGQMNWLAECATQLGAVLKEDSCQSGG